MQEGAPADGIKLHDSQVMSAFIKCTRLRRVDDAVYWFTVFVNRYKEPGQQFRLSRRILILAGEDCIDLPVQWAVSDWFRFAINCKDPVEWYRSAVVQIHLICATKNWWNTVEGVNYVYMWATVEQIKANNWATTHKSPAWNHFLEHVHVIHTYDDADKRREYAYRIAEHARSEKRLDARLTAAIHLRNHKMLSKDDNYLGQALYRLHVGRLGQTKYPMLAGKEISESVKRATERMKVPEKTPKWTQDGIHTYGSDRRFAGTVKNMLGCCCAFAKYGRLDPDDPHPDEFFDVVKAKEIIENSIKNELGATANGG